MIVSEGYLKNSLCNLKYNLFKYIKMMIIIIENMAFGLCNVHFLHFLALFKILENLYLSFNLNIINLLCYSYGSNNLEHSKLLQVACQTNKSILIELIDELEQLIMCHLFY